MALANRDIFWLAGLFEGEGTAGFGSGRARTFRLRIRMTDRDIIERVAHIWGVRVCGPYFSKTKLHYLPVWSVNIGGREGVAWGMMLLPLMGKRRAAKLEELIRIWKGEWYASEVPCRRSD
jgi:hypothetical protein